MSEYIVSARKYRPLTFGSVVGQTGLTTTLKNAIAAGKLAHAYLFCGPRGVGKTTSARIFAKTINCMNPTPEGDACSQCESCRAFNEHRSFNIHELDAASNNSVEDIRTLIDEVYIPPQVGRYKVFIIDEVHMLSQAAFNAFLKTLEEPPSHVIFILATTEKHKILPTILSRCQVYDFKRITTEDIVAHLRNVAASEGYTTDDEALAVIAEKADGGMRDALSVFDQVAAFTQGDITYDKVVAHLGVLNTQYYFQLVDHLLSKEIPQAMLLFNEVLNKGFDGGLFINGLATHVRNLMMCRDTCTLPLLDCSDNMRERYAEQAARSNNRFIYKALKLCNQCDLNYRPSRNKRLLVEITLIQIAQSDEDPVAGSPRDILNPIFELEEDSVSSAPSAPAAKTESAQPVLRRISLGTSISAGTVASPKQVQQSQHDKAQADDQQPSSAVPQPQPATFNAWSEESLLSMWNQYANQLPNEESIMAQRMRATVPQISHDATFVVTIDNENIMPDWQKIKPGLEAYMNHATGRTDITMHIQANKQADTVVMTPREWFEDMKQRNPLILNLYTAFKLDFA